MPGSPHPRSFAAVAAVVAVIALATLVTWPAQRFDAADATRAREVSSHASGSTTAPLAMRVTDAVSPASCVISATATAARDATAGSSRPVGAPDTSSAAVQRVSSGALATNVGDAKGTADAAATTIPNGGDGDRRDPLAGVRALGTPGIYRNRVAGSWVNVPPPDRHYDRPTDPTAPTGAG